MKNSFCPARLTVLCSAFVFLALAGGCAQQVAQQPKSYTFWPPFPQDPRILYLASYSANTDVEPAKTKMDEIIYGKNTESQVLIGNPYGVAMWNGRIYVCDTRNPAIEIFDLRKHQMQLMKAPDAGKLAKPVAIAIAPDGTKYIADVQIGAVAVFDASDHFARQIGHEDFNPVGVAVHGNELYVSDYKCNRIEVFDRFSGKSLRMIGSLGLKPGQMVRPLGIAVDDQGNIYVDQIVNCRVQKFAPDGRYLGTFGSLGDHPGTFTRPKHLAVDHDGVIYVVDAAFQNVQMFDSQFRPLLFFGNNGDYPGSMGLPAGICLDYGDLDLYADRIPDAFQAQYLILVTNQVNRNVSVYAFGHLKAGRTLDDVAWSKGAVPEGTTTRPAPGVGAPLAERK